MTSEALYTGFLLILRKISKIGATRCKILRLKMHQIRFLLGSAVSSPSGVSAPDPAGGVYSAPQTL